MLRRRGFHPKPWPPDLPFPAGFEEERQEALARRLDHYAFRLFLRGAIQHPSGFRPRRPRATSGRLPHGTWRRRSSPSASPGAPEAAGTGSSTRPGASGARSSGISRTSSATGSGSTSRRPSASARLASAATSTSSRRPRVSSFTRRRSLAAAADLGGRGEGVLRPPGGAPARPRALRRRHGPPPRRQKWCRCWRMSWPDEPGAAPCRGAWCARFGASRPACSQSARRATSAPTWRPRWPRACARERPRSSTRDPAGALP